MQIQLIFYKFVKIMTLITKKKLDKAELEAVKNAKKVALSEGYVVFKADKNGHTKV
jgi:hypothetical protein